MNRRGGLTEADGGYLCCFPAGESYPLQLIPSSMAAAAAAGLSPLQLQVSPQQLPASRLVV